MNELYVDGRIYFKTNRSDLIQALEDLIQAGEKAGIEICADGTIRLTDSEDRVIQQI